jgi:hypothetical protein
MKKILLWLIRFYQHLPSVWGKPCRFTPTCSEYCYEAINRYGILQGGLMGCQRVFRCQPWSRGGLDLVPQK